MECTPVVFRRLLPVLNEKCHCVHVKLRAAQFSCQAGELMKNGNLNDIIFFPLTYIFKIKLGRLQVVCVEWTRAPQIHLNWMYCIFAFILHGKLYLIYFENICSLEKLFRIWPKHCKWNDTFYNILNNLSLKNQLATKNYKSYYH